MARRTKATEVTDENLDTLEFLRDLREPTQAEILRAVVELRRGEVMTLSDAALAEEYLADRAPAHPGVLYAGLTHVAMSPDVQSWTGLSA